MSSLFSEDEILNYFLHFSTDGVVKNTDIVTHFRYYLSDPNIRDEARALFKSYVNKLANVKTENGEKYLKLKRQYFHSIDGRPSIPSSQIQIQQQQQQNYNQQPLNNSYGGYPGQSRPGHGPVYDSSSSSSGYPPHPAVHHHHPPLQRSLSQQSQSLSQSHLLGSAYSLTSNSNYSNDPYMNSNHNNYSYHNPNSIPPPPIPMNNYLPPPPVHPGINSNSSSSNYGILPPQPSSINNDYHMEYGLPPPPNIVSSSPKRYPSPPSNSNNSPGRLLPPPYRPPPPGPAARFGQSPTTTTAIPPYMSGPIRHSMKNNNINYPQRFPSSPPNQNFNSSEPSTPTAPPYLIQRSLSVSGSLTSPLQYEGPGKYFDNNNLHSSSLNPSLLPTPAPPVPPRSKRASFERSTSKSSMSVTMEDSGGGMMMMAERRNSMGGKSSIPSLENSIGGGNKNMSSSSSMLMDRESVYENNEKENVNMIASVPYRSSDAIDGIGSGGGGCDAGDEIQRNDACNVMSDINGNSSEVEQKISVKERLQKFNRIASESELTAGGNKMPSASRNRRDVSNKHDSVDYDTASLSSFGFGSMQSGDKEWILKAAVCDYHFLNKMASENPGVVKRKDINGYTALHWAAKHGNVDLVKMLAGTYKSNVNAKSNGGYTPLHLAAQFSRQEVYDILSQVYNADVNIRDHSGKKPMQYLVRQDTSVSSDTFKKLKDKRRSTEQREQRERDSSFLRNSRIGSLNIRVKKTTEAFNNFLGKSHSATSIERILHKSYGSAENINNIDTVDRDKQIMPPPSNPNVLKGTLSSNSTKSNNGKRKSRRSAAQLNDNSTTTSIKESHSDSDSDCGFGSDWKT